MPGILRTHSTVAKPNPDAAPVTKATCPSNEISMDLLFSERLCKP